MPDGSSTLKRWFVNGVAITVPLVVTVLILIVVVEFILSILSPIVLGIAIVWPDEPSEVVIQAATILLLILFFFLVGIAAEYTPGERISGALHRTIETIPGVSTLYATVRRASEVLVDDDTAQFKEVKLVEFPHEGAFMLGFLTADTPETIEESLGGDEMLTIMVPLGPNPTTNGFVMHMPAENVHDVDITVEEAIRSIATLGVTTDGVDEE